jgi:hypothetical protein
MISSTTPFVFTPGASVTVSPTMGNVGTAATFALPTVDGSLDMTIANQSGGAIWFQIGDGASILSGPTVGGSIKVEAGSTYLLRTVAGFATAVGVCAPSAGSIVFTRGTALSAEVFQ